MSQKIDLTLVKPTLYLSEVAFMKNEGYQELEEGMTGEALGQVLRNYVDEYKGERDEKLIDYVKDNFSVVASFADPNNTGLNAIIFHREVDDKYFVVADGMHTYHYFHEAPVDAWAVALYPMAFRKPGSPNLQLTQFVDFIRENLPEGKTAILTGQSLGGTNATAAAIMLGDLVETAIAFNAPNPVGWATLSDGNFVKISRGPSMFDLSGIPQEEVTEPGLTVEIVLSNVDSSRIFQLTNKRDPFAGRVILDNALTQGTSVGTRTDWTLTRSGE